MLLVFSLVLIILQLFYSIKRSVYGLCYFIIIRVLVPEIVRSPIPALSLNSMMIVVLLAVMLLKGEITFSKIWQDSLAKFLVCFLLWMVFTLPFSSYLNFPAQFQYTIQFILTDYLPAFLTICLIKNRSQLDLLIKSFLSSLFITLIYGIISFILNDNPYLNFINSFFPQTTVTGAALSLEYTARHTSSTFISTNSFGYYLTYMMLFLLLIQNKLKKEHFYWLVFLVFINIILSSKRSPLIVIGFIGLLILYRKPKYIIPASVCSFLGISFLFLLPSMEDVKKTFMTALFFWDTEYAQSNGIIGSSVELRYAQVFYPFIEILDNLFLGHGSGWCRIYLKENLSIHPILYGFETIFSSAICELGIAGVFWYIWLFISSKKYISKYCVNGFKEYKTEKTKLPDLKSKGHLRISMDNKINYTLYFVVGSFLLWISTGVNYIFYYFIMLVIFKKASEFGNYSISKL